MPKENRCVTYVLLSNCNTINLIDLKPALMYLTVEIHISVKSF